MPLYVFRSLAWCKKIIGNPKTVVVIFVSFLVLCAVGLPHLKAITTISDLVNESYPEVAVQRALEREFAEQDQILVIFRQRDGTNFTGKNLCEIQRWSIQFYRRSESAVKFLAPFFLRQPELVQDRLIYPTIMSDVCSLPADAKMKLPFEHHALKQLITNLDASDLAIEFKFKNSESHPPGKIFKDISSSLQVNFPDSGPIDVLLVGNVAFKGYYREALFKDQMLNILLLCLLLILFRGFFGTWKGGFILLSTLIATGIIVYGGMGWFGVPIDLLANSLFILIAIAAIEDFLLLSHVQMQNSEHWQEPYRLQIVPSFYTSLTTMIGFGSLAVSDIAAIQRFGVWAATGALAEWSIVFLVLPKFAVLCPSLRGFTNPRRALNVAFVEKLARWRMPRMAVYLALVLLVLAPMFISRIEVNDSPALNFPPSHPFTQALNYVKASRGWSGSFNIIFKDLKNVEANQRVLSSLRNDSNVQSVVDGYSYMENFAASAPEEYRKLVKREFALSPIYREFFSKNDLMRGIVFVKSTQVSDLSPLKQKIEMLCRDIGCFASGDLISYVAFSDNLVDTFTDSLGLSEVLVGLILLFLGRNLRIRNLAAVVLSIVWGPCVSLLLFPLFGITLNFCTSTFATIMVGLAGDNAIHYIYASRSGKLEDGLDECGAGSLRISAIMTISILILMFSSFWQPRILGAVFAAGFALLFIGDLWVLRGFLSLFDNFSLRSVRTFFQRK
jgi:predicted RND superfamily exporter protein